LLRQREYWAFGLVGTAYVMLSPIAVLAMKPAEVNTNRLARLRGGRMALNQ
jgi:hypothetical protein